MAGQAYYDLRGFTPEDMIGVTSVWDTVSSAWLDPVGEPDSVGGVRWEASAGQPQVFWMRGIYWLGVWPIPSDSTGYIRVHFSGLAPHFVIDQDVLAELPDDFIPALEDYALYEMSAQDGETSKAMEHYKNYSERSDAFRQFVERRTVTARHGVIGSNR